jgi:hypothetical protein
LKQQQQKQLKAAWGGKRQERFCEELIGEHEVKEKRRR